MTSELRTWQYKDINIDYYAHLDGDGRSMAEHFVEMIKQKFADRIPFDCCYEWCSGPGFIGFALLAENICKRLVLADINPEAVELALATVKKNNLESKVTVYKSDNLQSIARHEKFDLVVSNPPNYYCINPLHPSYNSFIGDLRPNDPEWKIHREFYGNIKPFLNDKAILCIEEVDPFATKCYMPNAGDDKPLWGPEPFDIRPREPIFDFQEMIAQGGLTFDETVVLPNESVPIHVLISHFEHGADESKIIICPGIVFMEQVGELANGTYRLFGMENNKIKGHVDLPDEQLWLISMIELLVIAGEQGVSLDELVEKLNISMNNIESASAMLRNMAWAF